jgi:hypothetical protein
MISRVAFIAVRKRGHHDSVAGPSLIMPKQNDAERSNDNTDNTRCGIVRHSTLWLLCRIRHRSHRQSFIFAVVSPLPQRPARASGRFAKGHSEVSSPRNHWCNCSRTAGVNPLRVRRHTSTCRRAAGDLESRPGGSATGPVDYQSARVGERQAHDDPAGRVFNFWL